jgi:surface polysaccharide O-acyltransferase-like enzyme
VSEALAPDAPPAPAPRAEGRSVDWVSWLRILAITGVVAIHVSGSTAVAEGARGSTVGRLAIALDIGFVFVVPLFVMLAGVFALDPGRYRGARSFLRRRVVRLVPPVVFWHLLYWAFLVRYVGRDMPPGEFVRATLTGDLFPHLYFFWIVLGLTVVTPLLVPFVASSSRRAVAWAGVAGVAMAVAAVPARELLGQPASWVETPWTWWLPYAGLYLLGFALRDVVLPTWAAVGVLVAAAALAAELTWQWRNPAAPDLLDALSPVSYYGVAVQLLAVMVFLVGRSAVRSGGPLAQLARGPAARRARSLGDATLGVFALHLVVYTLMLRLPVVGGDAIASTPAQLLVRIVVVLAATYAAVLLLRMVPFVRAVL